MALASTQTAVSTTAVLIASARRIKNCSSASTTVYLGGSNVSSANGYPLEVNDEVLLTGTSDVYVVTGSGNGVVATLSG